jgi:alpha-amylase/alpha-mannosidase (GH57 family)
LLAKRGLHVRDEEWPAVQKRFKTQDYLDLQVWFNLAWTDPWLRSQDAELSRLEGKGSRFTEAEKGYVLDCQLKLIAQVIPAYREAAARGQVELTTSPYYHPILPLLCDTRAAHAALPHLPLPEPFRHPEDARWQLEEGLRRHEAAFGSRPQGLWPSEGSVSEEVVRLACEAGIRWLATDEEILWRTLKRPRELSMLYRPHLLRRKAGQTAIVFRDRELSDLIGFVYSQWDPQIAIADLLARLGDLHQQFRAAAQPPLVSIILDGENAWECYQRDGHEFLAGLYQALASDGRFRCVTVSEFLREHPLDRAEPLPELFSGSWIDGNFATWIGHPEKNAAWRHLGQARQALAAYSRQDQAHAQAWRSLGVAEGSDWMWWFGDTHFSAQADEFDRLFRAHLGNAYRSAGLEPPAALAEPIRHRVTEPLYGPTGLLHPLIDGRESSYYEWLYAGRLDLKQHYGAIQRGSQCLRAIHFGFDEARQYLRLDLDRAMLDRLAPWTIQLTFSPGVAIRIASGNGSVEVSSERAAEVQAALGRILEVAVPLSLLEPGAGKKLPLTVALLASGEVVERYPSQGAFELPASISELEAHAWPV